MSQTGQRPRRFTAVGIDLGGTWLRLVALRDGRVTRRVHRAIPVSQLANFLPTRLGRDKARTALVVAARGVWTPAERRRLQRRLGGVAARVAVISDAEAALLGALDAQPGLLILAGTGSIVLGRDGAGRLARAGGLGPLIGDEGSAFWLGREWLRLAPEAAAMARALARRPDAVTRIAALAPRVLARARRGDRRARAVVAAAQGELADLAARVVARLRLRAPVRVSWGGGLLADGWYRAGVRRALARRVRCRWQPRVSPSSWPPDGGPSSAVRRIVITVCPRETGTVLLAVERGERPRRLDARAVLAALTRLVAARGVGAVVQLREGCAGGCGADGPNVDVTIYPATPPGAKPDHVAVDWKTYVYSLPTLDALATVIDENLPAPAASARRRRRAR